MKYLRKYPTWIESIRTNYRKKLATSSFWKFQHKMANNYTHTISNESLKVQIIPVIPGHHFNPVKSIGQTRVINGACTNISWV
jgi:flavorubredoxin